MLNKESINIYLINIRDQPYHDHNRIFDYFMTLIPLNRKEKIIRFNNRDDAKRALLGDILTRYIVCKQRNLKIEDIQVDNNQYGKPFFKNIPDFHFNVSHSGDWVVCVAHNSPVGTDIEQVQPIEIDIAKRFFSRSEYQALIAKDSSEQLSFFYDIWTAKESYIKAVGKGLSIPLDSFSFAFDGEKIVLEPSATQNIYYFKRYLVDPKYKLTVCALTNEFADNVLRISLDELYEFMVLYIMNPWKIHFPFLGR